MLNPEVLRFIPKDSSFDMTELLAEVVGNGLPVAAFPIHEQWIDIGRTEDLDRAREAFCAFQDRTKEEEK